MPSSAAMTMPGKVAWVSAMVKNDSLRATTMHPDHPAQRADEGGLHQGAVHGGVEPAQSGSPQSRSAGGGLAGGPAAARRRTIRRRATRPSAGQQVEAIRTSTTVPPEASRSPWWTEAS